MLLNQCLAISLSPINGDRTEHRKSASGEEGPQETRLSLAQILFKQLIEQNRYSNNRSLPFDKNSKALSEALDRLEFAGFMVPSWLLVSGAYDDLHRVKTSWSEGTFQSPKGFKIETIGNIRSVNVDYFGLTCSATNATTNEQITRADEAKLAQVSPSNASEQDQSSSRSGGSNRHCQDYNQNEQSQPTIELRLLGGEQLVERLEANGHRCPLNLTERPMTQQQRRQTAKTAYADQLVESLTARSSRISSASTNKSKSTTLDSGCQSWDLVSSGGGGGGTVMAAGETASSDLGNKSANHLLPLEQVVDGEDHEDQENSRRRLARRGLTSLARSLSFRPKRGSSLASAGNRWLQSTASEEMQTPSGGSLFRSCSVRVVNHSRPRTILGHCDTAGKTNGGATIDYLASAAQHTKRFSIRRNSLLAFGSVGKQQPSEDHIGGGRLVHFLRKLFNMRRARVSAGQVDSALDEETPPEPEPEPEPPARMHQTNKIEHVRVSRLANYETQQQLLASKLPPLSSPSTSSDSSSGSNSLIEILDCSRAVQSSRRPLRHEERSISSGLRRASWRVVKRSESSLSHNSEASSSTTKSTVSQQLRRHLDEACKRPRNCANQSEKDFIDSINVLRHASRHALQSSRSSSKSRQAKSVGTKSQESGDDSVSSVGSPSCVCSHQEATSGAAKLLDGEMTAHHNYQIPQQHNLDLMVHQAATAANCCLCSSFLANSARLCPLATTCCPAPTASAYNCCLSLAAPRAPAGSLEESAELCCPIWRSMLYNYYPPPYGLGESALLQQPHNPIGLQTSQQLAGSQSISSSHQQQHQHNTTIDLKIEIGAADFNGGNKSTRKTSVSELSAGRREPETTDDSLNSGEPISDESLTVNKKQLEPDSCDSDAKSDSLGANQTGFGLMD